MADRQTLRDAPPVAQPPEQEAAYPRMTRPVDGQLVAGVAQGIAQQLRLDPVVIRLAFVLLTVVHGAGVVAYAAMWLFTPRRPHEGPPPQRDWSQFAAFPAIGMALMAFGWLPGAAGGGIATW